MQDRLSDPETLPYTEFKLQVAAQNVSEVFARGDSMRSDVDEVRERGTALISALVRHRQRGSDLMYEGYSVDIGGQD